MGHAYFESDFHPFRKRSHHFRCHVLHARDAQHAEVRQPGERRDSGVGQTGARVERDLLEGRDAAQQLRGPVGNPSVAGEILLQIRQVDEVRRRKIASVAAIHQDEGGQSPTSADVAITVVRHIHRHQFLKGRKARQRREALIIDVLAAHG